MDCFITRRGYVNSGGSSSKVTPEKLGYVSGANAFFDGRWNTPYGHVSDGASWTDLVHEKSAYRVSMGDTEAKDYIDIDYYIKPAVASGGIVLPIDMSTYSSFTVEAVVKIVSLDSYQSDIINTYASDNYGGFGITAENSTKITLQAYSGGWKNMSSTYTKGEIVYVAMTFDGSSLKSYINGIYLSEASCTNKITNTLFPCLGVKAGGKNEHAGGQSYYYRAAIYDKVLTADEITQNYNRDVYRYVNGNADDIDDSGSGDKPSATVEKSTVSFTANITSTSKYTVEYKTLYDTAPAFELYINDELKGTYSAITNNTVVIDLADLALSISKAKVVIKSTSYYVGISQVYSDGFMSMTADTITTDDGDITASADSYRSGCNPYYAFDGSTDTSSYWLANTKTTPTWLQIQFPTAKVLKSFVMYKAHAQYDDCVKAFTLQGSNDGSSYVDLGSYVFSEQLITVFSKTFEVNNSTAYTTYRFYITSANNYPMINEISMFFDEDINITNELSIVNMGDGSDNNDSGRVLIGGTVYTGTEYNEQSKPISGLKVELTEYCGFGNDGDFIPCNADGTLGFTITSSTIQQNYGESKTKADESDLVSTYNVILKNDKIFAFKHGEKEFHIITKDTNGNPVLFWCWNSQYIITNSSGSTGYMNYVARTNASYQHYIVPMCDFLAGNRIDGLYLVAASPSTSYTDYFVDFGGDIYRFFGQGGHQFAVKVST